MATTTEYGLGPFTYPRGWFMIADSAELTDKVLPLRFFGQEFALYRGENGQVILHSAICPHMGTNIARNTTSHTTLSARRRILGGKLSSISLHTWGCRSSSNSAWSSAAFPNTKSARACS